MGFANTIMKAVQSTAIPLNTLVAGTTTSAAGLVINPGDPRFPIEFDSLVMNVTAAITTSTIVVTTIWQVSDDGTNWRTLFPLNNASYVAVAAAGSGSLVTTNYVQTCNGYNPGKQYIRAAVINTVVTGAAGDNVTISYNWRRRAIGVAG